MLRLEAGMHTAMINRIDTDAAGRYLITASDDKTARIWEVASGRLLRTLRPPLGPGDEGKLYACAMSPDGRLAAVGGWTKLDSNSGDSVYIFDRSSGRLLRRLTGLPNVIFHLAFSRDGRRLAATLGRDNGVRVFSTSDWSPAFKDTDYGYDSYWADFDSRGRLVTTCNDGFVRLYDKSGRLLKKTRPPGGKRPFSAVFSPDGSSVAVGYADSTKVDVLSGRDLSHLFSPDTQGIINDLSKVAWSADGRFLFAGGRYNQGGFCPIRRWSDSGRGGYKEHSASKDVVMAIKPLPDGGIVFGSGDPAWGVFSPDGNKKVFKGPAIADHRDAGDKFRLSKDSSTVEFGFKVWGKDPARFDLAKRHLKEITGHGPGLVKPRNSSAKLKVKDWKNKRNPKLNDKPLTLEKYERSRSLALMPDDSGFLLGTEWHLRFFDSQGREKWKIPVPGGAFAVNIAPNGKTCAAAFGDGTIRWYRVSDGHELLAFFPHKDPSRGTLRWVIWTPKGYYDCSPGAEELVGWHLNQGPDRSADFFPASKFRGTFYRPDVVAKVLTTLDEAEAVKRADAESNRKAQAADIKKKLPPVVRIVSPRDGTRVSTREVTIRYKLRSPSGEPVTGIRALIDGRPVARKRKITRIKKGEGDRSLTLAVPERDCQVSIIAENKYSASDPATIRLRWKKPKQAQAQAEDEFVIKPKLYVLAIGVNDYPGTRDDLRFAAKDARDFCDVVKRQKGLLYRDVRIKLLTDGGATRDDILDGLEWIERQTTQNDVAMIFLAGHGVNDKSGDYYFLPGRVNPDRLRRTGLPFTEIKKTVASLAGKALFFVDTCHSGNVLGTHIRRGVADITAVVNELASAENGAVVFSSSTGRQYSLEDAAWGNGAFTKALVEALSGKADYTRSGPGKGKITINEVDLYLSERVKELTDGRQTPTTAKPKTVPDFPVALVR